jgi:predicted transcriptional regulator
MEVLWDKSPVTVGQVVEALPQDPPLAYSTVLTMLRILEQKGYLRHEKRGRAFVYSPIVNRGQAQRSAVQYLLNRFFNDSPEQLVLNVLEHEQIDSKELKRLRDLIKQAE